VLIQVATANDPPTFTLTRTSITLTEDAGAQLFVGVITGASPGPADESGQTLSYSVALSGVSGNLSFSAAPAILSGTDLTFTPAPDANATATLLVIVTDSSGAATTKAAEDHSSSAA